MKILFLSPVVPFPLVDGDRQRAYHLLKHLARKHSVHLICFLRHAREQTALAELSKICHRAEGVLITRNEIWRNCFAAWPTSAPLNVAAFRSDAMRRKLAGLAGETRPAWDLVYAYRLRMAPYALQVKARRRILDFTDALTRNVRNRVEARPAWWLLPYLRHEAERLAAFEPAVSHAFDASVISADKDRELLLELGAARTLQVVTNGVDVRAYRPAPSLTAEPRVLFVGNLNYPANRTGMAHFCRHIWPRVLSQQPDAVLTLIGAGRREEWQYRRVEWLGVVPDLKPHFRRARVGICPLEVASGRQFKVLEYMAAGLPAVVTSLVADNLGVTTGQAVVADDPDAFARGILNLMEDSRLADRLRKNSRSFVEKHYDWSVAGRQLEAVWRSKP